MNILNYLLYIFIYYLIIYIFQKVIYYNIRYLFNHNLIIKLKLNNIKYKFKKIIFI